MLKNYYSIKLLLSYLLSAQIVLISFSSQAQSNNFPEELHFTSSEIIRDENTRFLIHADMNGDGSEDILFSSYSAQLGRELLIYHQLANGSYDSQPQHVEIKTEIIAIGIAELRSDPGMELLLLANNGVFSLSTAIDGYAGNINKLIDWELIATVPNQQSVTLFRGVFNADDSNYTQLLLPGIDSYGYFRGGSDESFVLEAQFSTLNKNITEADIAAQNFELSASLAISSEEGIKIELSTEAPSPFEDFIEDFSKQSSQSNNLLEVETWQPTAILAQLDSDSLSDIVYLNIGDDILGQLNIHHQHKSQGFADTPDWQQSLDTEGELLLADVNGDQLVDIYRVTASGNDSTLQLYLNQQGEFDFESPSQVMKFSGYDINFNFIDIDDDGRPELNVSFYTIPIVDVIRNSSIIRTQLLFSASEDVQTVFKRRPDSRLEESFSAQNARGLAQQMSLTYDVNGDGIKDAVYITEEGGLAAKQINAELEIAAQPFWTYIPSQRILGFSIANLNQDGRPDLILSHASSHSLLVATP
ncbi:MAG: hypothetical protein COC19_05350 [SAR86 cluster bacterium]|uniref:VCBS repeat-containing protein n=1 Tax=SAR86 cluster bacterium TaxID=2030880 RepID=A0A2A4ML74_9GAMM|nr:MAG: hypothetical protein COC19_05350 [SAR86 cluster bacterium]